MPAAPQVRYDVGMRERLHVYEAKNNRDGTSGAEEQYSLYDTAFDKEGEFELETYDASEYVAADTEKFPELAGWYYHPVDGWVEGGEVSKETWDVSEAAEASAGAIQSVAKTEASTFLDLLDEMGWEEMNGTRDGTEMLQKFRYLDLCDEKFLHMSQEGKKVLADELVRLCTPNESINPIHPGRLLNEIKYYVRYLADVGRVDDLEPLLGALQNVASSDMVSYIAASRAHQMCEELERYGEKNEFGRRQEIFEGWQDKLLVQIAPGIVGSYTDRGIYIPSDPKYPEVIDKKLAFDDLSIIPVGNTAGEVTHASDVWTDYYLRNPEVFRTLPLHVRRCMNQLALPEQAQVVQFMQEGTVEDFDVFSHFVAAYGHKGARAFLSLELNDRLGESIVAIGNNVPSKHANKLFDTYGAMVDEIHSIEQHLCGQYGCSAENNKGELVQSIAREVFRDATTLLEVYASELQRVPDDRKEEVVGRLQQQLETFRANAHLTAVLFRHMQQEYPDLALEEVAGLSIETLQGSEIPLHIAEQMLSIYMENYAAYPEEFREALCTKFQDRQDTNTRFHMVLDSEENVLSFMSFTDMEDGSVYFGSNNTNPWLKGKRVGGALMHAVVPQEGLNRMVRAHCVPSEPISQSYLNRLGFVGIGIEEVGGVPLLAIERAGDTAGVYASKLCSDDDIVAGRLPEGAYVTQVPSAESFAFAPRHTGDVLTKLFTRDGVRYEVFDRPPSSLSR